MPHRQFEPAEFANEYRLTLRRLRSQEQEKQSTLMRQLETVANRTARVVDAIADGGPLASLRAKLNELELGRAHVETEQLQVGSFALVADIHPNLPELYKRRVADLERILRGMPMKERVRATFFAGSFDES